MTNDQRMSNAQMTKICRVADLAFVIRHFSSPMLLCALMIIFLAACGDRITNANIDAINAEFDRAEKPSRDTGDKGVSPKEVESILGVPTRTENFKMEVQTRRPVVEGV